MTRCSCENLKHGKVGCSIDTEKPDETGIVQNDYQDYCKWCFFGCHKRGES